MLEIKTHFALLYSLLLIDCRNNLNLPACRCFGATASPAMTDGLGLRNTLRNVSSVRDLSFLFFREAFVGQGIGIGAHDEISIFK